MSQRRWHSWMGLAATAMLVLVSAVEGEVVDIRGGSSVSVIQSDNGVQTQTDLAQEIVPTTTPTPPAISRARLERLDSTNTPTAAGDAVAVFETPSLFGGAPPNDVGIDLGAFSNDDRTSWFVEGRAYEVRTVVLQDSESQGNLLFGGPAVGGRSRITLSGVLIVASLDPSRDLTGVEARFSLRLDQRRSGPFAPPPQTLVSGEVALVGGPNGSVEITTATGAFETMFIPILDFTIPDALPLVRAVQFAGTEIPYDFEFGDNEQFELELSIAAELYAIAGGTAAGAIFGMPPDGLASVLDRVKQDDTGGRLAEVINQSVDTTGASYGGGSGPFAFLFPMCGAAGIEAMFGFALGLCLFRRRIRRGHAGAGHCSDPSSKALSEFVSPRTGTHLRH